jgi:hypothetical protein
MFESQVSFAPGDKVLIKFSPIDDWKNADMVTVEIVKSFGNSYEVSFKVDGNRYFSSPNKIIKKKQIVQLVQSNCKPAIGDDPAIISTNKISNDLVINGYPKQI